jgi:hypothetical protein
MRQKLDLAQHTGNQLQFVAPERSQVLLRTDTRLSDYLKHLNPLENGKQYTTRHFMAASVSPNSRLKAVRAVPTGSDTRCGLPTAVTAQWHKLPTTAPPKPAIACGNSQCL